MLTVSVVADSSDGPACTSSPMARQEPVGSPEFMTKIAISAVLRRLYTSLSRHTLTSYQPYPRSHGPRRTPSTSSEDLVEKQVPLPRFSPLTVPYPPSLASHAQGAPLGPGRQYFPSLLLSLLTFQQALLLATLSVLVSRRFPPVLPCLRLSTKVSPSSWTVL